MTVWSYAFLMKARAMSCCPFHKRQWLLIIATAILAFSTGTVQATTVDATTGRTSESSTSHTSMLTTDPNVSSAVFTVSIRLTSLENTTLSLTTETFSTAEVTKEIVSSTSNLSFTGGSTAPTFPTTIPEVITGHPESSTDALNGTNTTAPVVTDLPTEITTVTSSSFTSTGTITLPASANLTSAISDVTSPSLADDNTTSATAFQNTTDAVEQYNSTSSDIEHSLAPGSIIALAILTTVLLVCLAALAFILIRRKLRMMTSYRRLMDLQLSDVDNESAQDPAFITDL